MVASGSTVSRGRPAHAPVVTYRVLGSLRSVSAGRALSAKSAKPSSTVISTGRGGSGAVPLRPSMYWETVSGWRPLATTASRWARKTAGVTANGAIQAGGSAVIAWYTSIGTAAGIWGGG